MSDFTTSLLICCKCQRSITDPVTLECLHSCCRLCIVELRGTASNVGQQTSKLSYFAKCPACCEETEYSLVMSNGFLRNYQRLTALNSETVYCSICDAADIAAVFWCTNCSMGLSECCYSLHGQFTRHHRCAELEVVRTWPVSHLTPDVKCDTHQRNIELLCFTCRKPNCQLCGESCRAGKHDMHRLSHEIVSNHLSAQKTAAAASLERLSRALSVALCKYQDMRMRLQKAHWKKSKTELAPRKRTLLDSSDKAYDAANYNVSLSTDMLQNQCVTVAEAHKTLSVTVKLATRNVERICVEYTDLKHLLCAKHLLKDITNCCRVKLDKFVNQQRKSWQDNETFSVVGSLPLTSDIVLRSCLGVTSRKRAAPSETLSFGQVYATFTPDVDCWDLALTRDCQLLLAAAAHGLLVYNDRGEHLSTWRPANVRNGRDGVSCVATLSDGRAAVGVVGARIVVLLRRETHDMWLQDCQVAQLQFHPWRVAVHCDLLAAVECRLDQQQELWVAGRKIKLKRLGNKQLLCTQNRKYDIVRVALTALCLITTSYDPVESNGGSKPYLVDAYSHSGELLWCYETGDDEATFGLCVSDETWSQVYVTVVKRSDWSNIRVIAIGGADGKVRRNVMSSRRHGLQLPWHLSVAAVGHQRTVLAAASRLRAAGQYRQARLVTLYEATHV